jgi:hypothetical protein
MQLVSGESPRSDRERNQREKIRLLHTVGLTSGEIAEIIGTTPNTVSVALVSIRREAKGKKPPPKLPKKPSKVAMKALPASHADDTSLDEVQT